MKLITRNTDYSVRALCHMTRRGKEQVPVSELVAALKIPGPFLRKLLQTLSAEGILRSTRGKGGGFTLAKSPETILLTDLIRIFQDTVRLNQCIFKKKPCPNRGVCVLKKEIDQIERNVLDRLSRISIASLS